MRKPSPSTALSNAAYPLHAVRALALHAQGLDAPPTPRTTDNDAHAVYDAIQRIGWLQLDTLQMVRRSQYIALWSRLGEYAPEALDALVFGDGGINGENTRRLFEYWMHAACIIPLTAYRYTLPTMRRHQRPQSAHRQDWLADASNRRLLDDVMGQAHKRGLIRSADFGRVDGRRGTWWDWKPAKVALEHLYNTGELTIANRINFQRIYGVTDRVLPDWVDRTLPSDDEANLFLLEQSARSIGICAAAQLPDYFHMKRTPAKPLTRQLLDRGTLLPVTAETSNGDTAEFVIHRDNLPLLQRASEGELTPRHTTFLSPFDSLFWARGRDMQLWGFRQILEAYKPRPQRIWGYFCLPILHNGRLVGRLDPKLERSEGILRLNHLYLEPNTAPDDELVAGIAGAMRSFMAFHDATDIVIEHSEPRTLRRKLLAAM